MEEFSGGFERFLQSIDATLRTYGIVKVVPPPGWATFTTYNPASAATDGPLREDGVFPRFKVITQAPVGKMGVVQLGIKERKMPFTAEQFREEALRRQGACVRSAPAVWDCAPSSQSCAALTSPLPPTHVNPPPPLLPAKP